MTPEELIAWHAHQIALLPETDNVMVQHHREAMHCVERLRAERDAAISEVGKYAGLFGRTEIERDRLRRAANHAVKGCAAAILALKNAPDADRRCLTHFSPAKTLPST